MAKKPKGGLTKWFKEDWRDVKTGKKCGRSGKKDASRPYPACRPASKAKSASAKAAAKKKTGPSRISWKTKSKGKKEMKAGQALGLLAGLGAMNAMSGKPYGGKRFTGLLDMLDGGGAGQSGDKFEGGGLLSALGNLFMKPLAAQENVERIGDKVRQEKSKLNQIVPTYGAKEGIANTERALTMPYNQSYAVTGYNVPETVSDYPNMSMPSIAGYTAPITRADNRPITADVLEQPDEIQFTLDDYIRAIGSQPNDYTRAQFADDFARQFGIGAGSQSSGMTNMGQTQRALQGYSIAG